MNACIYARYSTENQTENSIEMQVAACKEYAKANNIVITAIFKDEAATGMKVSREGLQELIDSIGTNLFDAIIIYDQSRLSRDLVDWFTLRKLVDISGVTLLSATGEQYGDISDPSTFVTEGVRALFNQLHVLTSRQKTKDGLRNIASKGLFAGGSACLGYDIIDRKYVINEDESKIVRAIFEMFSTGCGYTEIINYANAMGYKTKSGKTFGTNSLSSILRNERYIGVFTFGNTSKTATGQRNSHKPQKDMIRIEDAIPPIIEKDVWDKVKAKIKPRMNAAGKATVDYLLSGKIFCGHCGGAMCGEKRKGSYYYYMCSTRKRLKTCDKKAVRKEYIEELVINKIRELITPKSLDEIAAEVYKSMESVHDAIKPAREALQAQIRDAKKKIDNINNAIAEGVYSSSTVGKLKELELQVAGLYEKLGELSKTNVSTNKTLDEVKESLSLAIDSGDKVMIDLLVEKVICYDDGTFDVILNPMGTSNGKVRIPTVQPSSHHSYPYFAEGFIWMKIRKDTE